MKESATYQAILAEGALQEARRWLLRLGEKHLGRPTRAVTAAVEAITDVQLLEELGERLDQADNWEALLGLPVPRPRGGKRKKPSP